MRRRTPSFEALGTVPERIAEITERIVLIDSSGQHTASADYPIHQSPASDTLDAFEGFENG
jgi:hypothetical protein